MALSADLTVQTRNSGMASYVVTDGVTHHAGALVCVNRTTGRSVIPANTTGFRFRGFCLHSATGNSAGTVRVSVDTRGRVVERVSVTGVSDGTCVGKKVYLIDDDPRTMTLTPTTNIGAIGHIEAWRGGSLCDVLVYSAEGFEQMEATAVNP